jgi:DNA-binding GntR family transcriptional regulator
VVVTVQQAGRMPTPATKADYVYDVVRERILGGDLAAGAVIGQEQLALDLGVSTTPLREAMRRLAAEGLVVVGAHRDARVSALTADEARHLFEVRQALDPLAAGLAASRRTAAEADEVLRTLEEVRPLGEGAEPAALVAHRAFHRAVYAASHNPLLVQALDGLWDKADRYRRVGLVRQAGLGGTDGDRVRAEHRRLAEAVVAGDAAAAEAVMREHVAQSLGRRAIEALDG